jgi:hypothetical protein
MAVFEVSVQLTYAFFREMMPHRTKLNLGGLWQSTNSFSISAEGVKEKTIQQMLSGIHMIT